MPERIQLKLGKYKHYKGGLYKVVGIAKDVENLEDLVVYKALYESEFKIGQLWVRSLKSFSEFVEAGGKKVKRFSFVD